MNDPQNSSSTWFGHPPQLFRLFITEMWERFGYYGMRAILTLYFTTFFFYSDKVAGGLYGAFTSLVYLTPLFGGMLADNILGSKRSVKFGAILMSIGYFGLCFGGAKAIPFAMLDGKRYEIKEVVQVDSETSSEKKVQQFVMDDGDYFFKGQKDGSLIATKASDENVTKTLPKGKFYFSAERSEFYVQLMFLSLACVIIGNGFFKPNISTMVGSLYSQGDTRRDSGFTIFYMGINMGALLSQALCPFVAQEYGFWAGFLLAAIGMMIAYFLFQFDGGSLKNYGDPPSADSMSKSLIVMGGAILFIPLMWYFMNNTMLVEEAKALASATAEATTEEASAKLSAFQTITNYLMGLPILGKILFALFLAATIGMPIWASFAGTREELHKMFVATVLIVFSVVFWTLFEQAGSSLTLFADRNTDRNIFGWEMTAGQVQLFNALFIVALAPVFSWLWLTLGRRNMEPSTPVKFAFSLVLIGVGFLSLKLGAGFADDQFRVGIIWLILMYLFHTIAELCLSPVGLSMITKLSMVRVVGLMMGVWFLSTSMAQYVGGLIAQFASVETVGGEVLDPKVALDTYIGVFTQIAYVSMGIGLVLLIISPLLKKMMHGVR